MLADNCCLTYNVDVINVELQLKDQGIIKVFKNLYQEPISFERSKKTGYVVTSEINSSLLVSKI